MSGNILYRRAARVFVLLGLGLVLLGAVRAPQRLLVPQAPLDSIVVATPSFSPNGDGVLDSALVVFSLSRTAHVYTHVRVRGSADTVRVLVDSLFPASTRGAHATWDGRDRLGVLAPEGVFDFVFTSTDSSTQMVSRNTRQLRLDLTPPVVSILEVSPPRYTPSLPGTPSTVRVRVGVNGSEVEDRVGVELLTTLADTLTLPFVDGFSGDGEYVALCDSCPIARWVPDGVHRLEAFAFDQAGNRSLSVDSLDANRLGPVVRLTHPAPGSLAVQLADSLVGDVADRQDVVEVTLSIGATPDTVLVLAPRDGVVDAAFPFWVDVAGLLSTEADYPLRFVARDVDGVADTLLATLRVDRTPPAPPVPEPQPPRETKTTRLNIDLRLDPATISLYRAGGSLAEGIIDVEPPTFRQAVALRLGRNDLRFAAIDLAGNVSDTTLVFITRLLGRGIAAPERFSAGDEFLVDVEGEPARGATLRVLGLDGSLVREFEDASSRTVYEFRWNLLNGDGETVKNGAYLAVAVLRLPNGQTEVRRTMIAVVR